mmetsp:Transcript_43229/g.106197  ORF Transcript_43229/g.106197 Transcript_43229/m.106197 type:complete len:203 (-) Transcript_43229:45-653(-)
MKLVICLLLLSLSISGWAASVPPNRKLRAVLRHHVRVQPATRVLSGEPTSGRLVLNVFDKDYEVEVKEESELTSGPSTFLTGSVVGLPDSEVELLVNEHGTSGSIQIQGKFLRVIALGDGLVSETEIDGSKIRDPDVHEHLETPQNHSEPFSVRRMVPHREVSHSERQAASTYDALVVYTSRAEQDNGGATGTRNAIELMEG